MVVELVYIPTSNVWGILHFHILTNTSIFCFWAYSYNSGKGQTTTNKMEEFYRLNIKQKKSDAELILNYSVHIKFRNRWNLSIVINFTIVLTFGVVLNGKLNEGELIEMLEMYHLADDVLCCVYEYIDLGEGEEEMTFKIYALYCVKIITIQITK